MTTDVSLVGRLADALADRWRNGDPVPVETVFDEYPELWADPPAALELIAEELALRESAGRPADESELVERFPQWAIQVRALVACQRALGGLPGLPEPGDTLGEFELLAELGRGGHGRVFLAAQPQLGGRRVVLKVGPDSGGEHLSLARLQHTHIVPLYSAHDFPERRLRGLCLPDFGGLTLEKVTKSRPASGTELVALLGPSPDGVAAGFLQTAALADAVCWVGACLADALQYAHERGLLHLDVKPSNVLLAADGTPMLLDFHLARPPLAAGETGRVWVGGTPGHMAPEQDAAVAAVRQGRPVPQPVDGRADVFGLGLLLRELADTIGLRPSIGANDIFRRCTSPRPADRYPTAGDVAADLRRHLADRPLKGVRNRSLSERWRKWRRRQPLGLPAAALAAGLLAGGAGFVAHQEHLARQAEAAFPEADKLLADGRPTEATARLKAAADGLLVYPTVSARLRTRQAEIQLHAVAETARWLVAGQLPPEQIGPAVRACRGVWEQRAKVLAVTDAADELFDIGVAAGERAAAEREFSRPTEPRTTAQLVARGRERQAAGDRAGALADFDAAAEREPRSVWANHGRGVVLLELGRPVEAVAAFTRCLAERPELGWCWRNRGLAFRAAGQAAAADADFIRAGGPP